MLPILLLMFASFSLCVGLIAIAYFFAPKGAVSKTKWEDYECGLAPSEKTIEQKPVKFFLTAILFILFDIEIIFMYPFALAYRDFLEIGYGLTILLAMGLFIALFVFGLWWEIKNESFKLEVIGYGQGSF